MRITNAQHSPVAWQQCLWDALRTPTDSHICDESTGRASSVLWAQSQQNNFWSSKQFCTADSALLLLKGISGNTHFLLEVIQDTTNLLPHLNRWWTQVTKPLFCTRFDHRPHNTCYNLRTGFAPRSSLVLPRDVPACMAADTLRRQQTAPRWKRATLLPKHLFSERAQYTAPPL